MAGSPTCPLYLHLCLVYLDVRFLTVKVFEIASCIVLRFFEFRVNTAHNHMSIQFNKLNFILYEIEICLILTLRSCTWGIVRPTKVAEIIRHMTANIGFRSRSEPK